MTEIGIAFQTDKPPAGTANSPPRPRRTASTWSACSPTCVPAAAAPCSRWPGRPRGCGSARPASTRTPSIPRDRRGAGRAGRGQRGPRLPGAGPRHLAERSASTSGGRWPTCATPRRSCARCCPATTAATRAPRTGWRPESGCGTGSGPGAAVPPGYLGARGAALAGEIADEIKVGGSANPAMVRLIRDRVGVGASPPGAPGDQVVLGAVTVVDEDGPPRAAGPDRGGQVPGRGGRA